MRRHTPFYLLIVAMILVLTNSMTHGGEKEEEKEYDLKEEFGEDFEEYGLGG